MIRMIQSKSSAHAKKYFSEALSKSDYYTNDQELAGFWQGKLCHRLGLQGATSKDDFFALCDNLHPRTGEHLTPRTKDERTTGYDINFHCPKSVSLIHAIADDDHILNAFRDSVTETMKQIEADSKTRIRKDGIYDDRNTGELVWGHFVHQTARPVEGFFPDPHLHSHCYVFNATWDEQEQRIKAGQFRDIKRDMPFYQSMFHKVLSDKLTDLGYQIRKTDKSFEIDNVSQDVVNLFSKRTDEIGRIAKEKGITNPKELDELGSRTRAKKEKGHSMAELKTEWKRQIKELGKDGQAEIPVRFGPDKDIPKVNAKECVDFAKSHCFERASVIPERKILEFAYKRSIGSKVSVDEITKTFKQQNDIIHVKEKGRTLCTTKEVLAEEKHMVDLARKGQGKLAPLYQTAPELNLNGQQALAVEHILTTRDRVSIIRGAAGSGKTTLMKEAVEKINAAGKTVLTVAPTANASRGVLRKEGFSDAETVMKLLTDKSLQEKIKGQVLWVDEAGLLGTKDMTALLDLATRNNAQLILGGDTRQHASVVRGDALRILNTVAGIKSAEVNKIYRQKNTDYREAVEELSKGNVGQGFDKLEKLGFIKEIDPMQPNTAMVDDYIKTLKQGKTALVISPTNAESDKVTEQIRNQLREEGMIGKRETNVRQLKNLNLTEAERSDIRNIKPGNFVQFNQNLPGIGRGSLWMVEQVTSKDVYLKNGAGEIRELPTSKSKDYDVYSLNTIGLSKGDKIRITHNGTDLDGKRLDNGQAFEVVSVSKFAGIMLKNEISQASYRLDNNFGHIAHAHCITSYGSQGKTVDEVFIHQPAATFPATDAKQFYVSVSRAKDKTHLYTDDKQELLNHASEMGDRLSALELTQKGNRHKDFVEQMQRTKAEPTREQEKNVEQQKDKDHEPDR